MSTTLFLLAIFAVSFLGAIFWRHWKLASGQGKTLKGKVRRVVDGDSLYIDGVKEQIRLWGVDAPESDEPGYERARDALSRLVDGRTVTVTTLGRDNHGRILGRCFTDRWPMRREINRQMIASGHAAEYVKFTKGIYGGRFDRKNTRRKPAPRR